MIHHKKRILLIVPCYNEEKNIQKVLEEIRGLGEGYDIIVIDDGSHDSTSKIASAYAPVVQLLDNLGIGGAVQTGIKYAYQNDYDFCVQIDGDGQHLPCEVVKLIKHQQETDQAIIIGSRYIDNASFQSSWARRFGSRIIAWELNRFFSNCHITDPTSGMRLMNREAIQFFFNQYPYDFPEPISLAWALKRGISVGEISVKMRSRKYGMSSISTFQSFSYMFRVLSYILVCKFTKGIK